ncbi:MAG: hypothetical protein EA397_07170 [Deltaproteobacteria bacterium]|nr:MAG: hypothetical protein EA397_07170 [Deltaproteobacteria bacterium]
MRHLIALAGVLSLGPSALAAPPDEVWRTIETERFVMHYPEPAEAWAVAAAERLESMRDRVASQIDHSLGRKVTIVVRDPYATSNGMAIPFLRKPRTEIWVSPPPADSSIGWNRRWDEGLIVHEDAHLVHLGRPARGGLDRLLDRLTGFGPVARKSPRWVAEGYATLVEGDQTGFGRPFSARHAAELRKLATEGALPSYDELDGSPRWGGGGYAYGVGAAYLRWLRERAGPDSLPHLWRRMAAVETRTFDEAFEGVFGDTPRRLYGRFCAELTADAMNLHRAFPPDEGTRWLDLEGSTGAPALSPNGERLAFVAAREGKRKLEVYKTDFNLEEAEQSRSRKIEALLERDPLDVPDRPKSEPPVEQAFTRGRRDRAPSHPRWIDDDTLLFTGFSPDRTGQLRTDLYAWQIRRNQERRITRWADLREADPSPDGTWAVAVRQRWGQSGLVKVDLSSGEIEELTPMSVTAVHNQPRISPEGDRIAWLEMREDRWALHVRPLDGEGVIVPVPEGANLASPAWHPQGDRILVSMGTASWLDIVEIPLDGQHPRRLTRSHGGAFFPDARGESLFWIDEDADGRDLHFALLPSEGKPLPPLGEPSLAHVPTPPLLDLPDLAEVSSTRYGLGKVEGRGLVSGAFSRGDHRLELGARYGDPIGRHELLIFLAGGYEPRADRYAFYDGARVAMALRVLPFDLHLDAFAHRPILQPGLIGGAMAARDAHRFPAGFLAGEIGAGVGIGLGGDDRSLSFGSLRLRLNDHAYRIANLDLTTRAAGGPMGDGAGAWVRTEGKVELFDKGLTLGGGYGFATGEAGPLRLGGVRDVSLPDAWQIDRVLRGAFLADRGRRHATMSARAGQGLALMAERHLIGNELHLGRAHTVVGLEVNEQIEAIPFAKVPGAELEFGLGCLVEHPADGIRSRPCLRATDWSAWGAVTWRR